MRKLLLLVLALALLATLAACHAPTASTPSSENAVNTTAPIIDHEIAIMEHPEDYSRLSKAEFLKATEQYLRTGQWTLDYSQACFYTSGRNYCQFLVESNHLFSLDYDTATKTYSCTLTRFENSCKTAFETDPQLFEQFLEAL